MEEWKDEGPPQLINENDVYVRDGQEFYVSGFRGTRIVLQDTFGKERLVTRKALLIRYAKKD